MNNAVAQRVKIACVLGFLILAMHANNAFKIMNEKVRAQDLVTESVYRWTESINALNASIERWKTTYTKEDSLQDLRGLLELVDFQGAGLKVKIDGIGVVGIHDVTHNSIGLGLSKICLATTGIGTGTAVEVEAGDYKTLFDGLQRLAARPDLQIDSIVIRGDKKVPTATLGGFCVLLSKD